MNIFFRRSRKNQAHDETEYSVFISSDASVSNAPVLPEFENFISNAQSAFVKLADAPDIRTLAGIIQCEVRKMPHSAASDLVRHVNSKLKDVDGEYRSGLLKSVRIMYVDGFREITSACTSAESYPANSVSPLSRGYWMMAADACRMHAASRDPALLYLKYLLCGWRMFVLKKPAHPEGTPFPGGLFVESEGGTFFCPVRNKADDVPFSVCPFCPAVQSGEYMMNYSKEERGRKEKQGYIQNYFTNFKG